MERVWFQVDVIFFIQRTKLYKVIKFNLLQRQISFRYYRGLNPYSQRDKMYSFVLDLVIRLRSPHFTQRSKIT